MKGSANGRADTLSRQADYDQGTGDNQDVVVLPDKLFICATTTITASGPTQCEDKLRPWIDPHELRKINGYGTNTEGEFTQGGLTKHAMSSKDITTYQYTDILGLLG